MPGKSPPGPLVGLPGYVARRPISRTLGLGLDAQRASIARYIASVSGVISGISGGRGRKAERSPAIAVTLAACRRHADGEPSHCAHPGGGRRACSKFAFRYATFSRYVISSPGLWKAGSTSSRRHTDGEPSHSVSCATRSAATAAWSSSAMMTASPNEFKKCPRLAFVPVSEVSAAIWPGSTMSRSAHHGSCCFRGR